MEKSPGSSMTRRTQNTAKKRCQLAAHTEHQGSAVRITLLQQKYA